MGLPLAHKPHSNTYTFPPPLDTKSAYKAPHRATEGLRGHLAERGERGGRTREEPGSQEPNRGRQPKAREPGARGRQLKDTGVRL